MLLKGLNSTTNIRNVRMKGPKRSFIEKTKGVGGVSKICLFMTSLVPYF